MKVYVIISLIGIIILLMALEFGLSQSETREVQVIERVYIPASHSTHNYIGSNGSVHHGSSYSAEKFKLVVTDGSDTWTQTVSVDEYALAKQNETIFLDVRIGWISGRIY